MAAKSKSHPVWTAVGLVVLAYVALRLIYVFTQQRTSAAMSGYPYLIGGSGSYFVGSPAPAPVSTVPTPSPSPSAPAGSSSSYRRLIDEGTNPFLYLGPEPSGGPSMPYDGSGMAHALGGPQLYPGGAS